MREYKSKVVQKQIKNTYMKLHRVIFPSVVFPIAEQSGTCLRCCTFCDSLCKQLFWFQSTTGWAYLLAILALPGLRRRRRRPAVSLAAPSYFGSSAFQNRPSLKRPTRIYIIVNVTYHRYSQSNWILNKHCCMLSRVASLRVLTLKLNTLFMGTTYLFFF